jgi:hypothetical protein
MKNLTQRRKAAERNAKKLAIFRCFFFHCLFSAPLREVLLFSFFFRRL